MRRLVTIILAVTVGSAAALWVLSAPRPLAAGALDGVAGDPERGERVFHLGGCASCHAAEGAEGEARRVLSGGLRLGTPFGTFVAPNISPDLEHGIGDWNALDLANAMQRGVSPEGAHYYPAFPYTSYARASLQDVADLHAYLMTLPPSDRAHEPHELGFAYTIRRGIGLWNRLHLDAEPVAALAEDAPEAARRGQALAEGFGHCGECHTPRGFGGGLDLDRWLTGAEVPAVEGDRQGGGRTPALTPDELDWSAADIAYYLESGFTPDFDSVGGAMVDVVENLAQAPAEDREAIAAYLKALPSE